MDVFLKSNIMNMGKPALITLFPCWASMTLQWCIASLRILIKDNSRSCIDFMDFNLKTQWFVFQVVHLSYSNVMACVQWVRALLAVAEIETIWNYFFLF